MIYFSNRTAATSASGWRVLMRYYTWRDPWESKDNRLGNLSGLTQEVVTPPPTAACTSVLTWMAVAVAARFDWQLRPKRTLATQPVRGCICYVNTTRALRAYPRGRRRPLYTRLIIRALATLFCTQIAAQNSSFIFKAHQPISNGYARNYKTTVDIMCRIIDDFNLG